MRVKKGQFFKTLWKVITLNNWKLQQQERKVTNKTFFFSLEIRSWKSSFPLNGQIERHKSFKACEGKTRKNPVLSFQSQNFDQLFILGPRITNKRMLINKELSFKHVGKFYWALFAWHATSKCEKFPPSCKEMRASEEEHSIIKSKHFGILTLLLLIHWKSFTIVRDLYKMRSAKRFCFDVETKLKAFIKLSQQFMVSLLKGNWKGKYIKQIRRCIDGKVLTVNREQPLMKNQLQKANKAKMNIQRFFHWLHKILCLRAE